MQLIHYCKHGIYRSYNYGSLVSVLCCWFFFSWRVKQLGRTLIVKIGGICFIVYLCIFHFFNHGLSENLAQVKFLIQKFNCLFIGSLKEKERPINISIIIDNIFTWPLLEMEKPVDDCDMQIYLFMN